MKPVNFEYARPADLAAASALATREDAMVKFIAGGQSLGPMLNLRLVQPDILVDLSAIEELRRVECSFCVVRRKGLLRRSDNPNLAVADVFQILRQSIQVQNQVGPWANVLTDFIDDEDDVFLA